MRADSKWPNSTHQGSTLDVIIRVRFRQCMFGEGKDCPRLCQPEYDYNLRVMSKHLANMTGYTHMVAGSRSVQLHLYAE